MRDFRKQRGKIGSMWGFIGLCAALVVLLTLTVFSARAAWGMYVKFMVATQGDEASKRELSQLQVQLSNVSAAVGDLSTERGEEGQIRERFGVAKPGEGAIEIVRSATSSEAGAQVPEQNPFMRVLQALFVW